MKRYSMKSRVPYRLGLLVALATGAGCEVVNPGQILDVDLENLSAMPQLVQGMEGDFQVAINSLGWRTSALFGELAGAAFADDLQMYWRGDTDMVFADNFNAIHAARWITDDGIRRMQDVMGSGFSASPLAAQAYLWSGYSYRLLGDNMCQAVIDGGSIQDRAVYYQRAEERFTSAIELAQANNQQNFLTAARGGRASVRANLGNWSGALADAALVPDNYQFVVRFSSASTRSQNTIFIEHFQRQNSSVKYTFFENYFNQSGDRRVDNRDPLAGQPRLSADGRTPHRRQWKYTQRDSHVPLTKGAEMRLLEAEALIRDGSWAAGMDIINGLRANVDVAPWPATNAAEALDALITERAIVLWMESRRGGDYFRLGLKSEDDPIMKAQSTVVPDYVQFKLAGRETCFPMSRAIMLSQ